MSVNNIGAKSALTVGALAAAALVAVGVLGMHSVGPFAGMSRGLQLASIATGSVATTAMLFAGYKNVKDAQHCVDQAAPSIAKGATHNADGRKTPQDQIFDSYSNDKL